MLDQQEDKRAYEAAIDALQAEIANVGVHLTLDANARQLYTREIRIMANKLHADATAGRITWAMAAEQAQETRNTVMHLIRKRSTPVGLAIAEHLKREGKTLNELVARKTTQLHGHNAIFGRLSVAEQNAVYAEVVKSAGKSNPRVTNTMRGVSHAGRSLVVLSLGISVYTISTAENKSEAAKREVAITGAGIGGGVAGGALAGLACGPGAPVCVAVGAFAGGALAAFGVSYAW